MEQQPLAERGFSYFQSGRWNAVYGESRTHSVKRGVRQEAACVLNLSADISAVPAEWNIPIRNGFESNFKFGCKRKSPSSKCGQGKGRHG